ncbi:MAG: hypothetical protein EZS28_018503 [Streblomastix strix]|uniref:Uncharacterized protein n=1 Tax=Streblomastix strix TaxID=222440 RepID=A0A5J4VTL5_9EUKA|nr:MAG: hypothetical protein EZS28_018503 [Streblomastix strix]
MTLMKIEVEQNFNRLVKENEGIDDPRFSTIQSSLPPPIDPLKLQRIQEHNVNDRLNEPSNQMGSMAQPPNPDTQFKQLGEIAPKEYVGVLKETDEEQPFQYPVEEDAPPQYQQSAPTKQRYVDDFSDIASLKEEEREIVNKNRYKNSYGQIP